ncbi:MAG TPA: putative baseplate assembly protein, partial [Candidatus Dormibacteraeota bacterium]|nr:putative baseplate assembly protein [Candidatus Dormibacteraeota bacterium]
MNVCGCCGQTGAEGACACAVAAPAPVRPGLPAVPRRVGTHGSFLAAMVGAIHRQPGLRGLTVRDASDPAIALLDAWATVLDVVTFYQERIANEGYLRTATEPESVQRLAAEVGYLARPGSAATAALAFEVDSGPGAPAEPVVPAGTRVRSVPGPGEEPQTFETTAEITARAGWNQLGARRIDPTRRAAAGDQTLWLAGTATGLARGDALLVVHAGGADLRVVEAVRPRPELEATAVDLDAQVGPGLDVSEPGLKPGVYALRQRAALFGHNAPPWGSMSETFRADYV